MLELSHSKFSSSSSSSSFDSGHHRRDRLDSKIMSTISGPSAAVDHGTGGAKTIEEELSLPILLAERVRKAVGEAESFKAECVELGRQTDLLAGMLRPVVRRLSAIPNAYKRPARRIAAETSKSLDRAFSLVHRCRRSGILRHVVSITTGSTDFRKTFALLDASLGDLRWLLSIYSSDDPSDGGGGGGGLVVSLPPIASTDPILSWVWSYVAAVLIAARPSDRAEAATNLALDNDCNRKIIIEEGGVPLLLALLRDSAASLDTQIAATAALINLSTNRELVSIIIVDLAVPIVVQVLADSPICLQARLAVLVARMAVHDPVAQEEFAREIAIRPLVSLLSFELPLDDTSPNSKKPTSIHTLVRINRESATNSPNPPNAKGVSTSRDQHPHPPYYYYHHRKERENESPEMKLHLKVACAKALWMLSRNCVSNSRKIAETKGLLYLSKLIERARGELQINCLMTVMEIATAAKSDADLQRSAFKMNSPAAKSMLGIQDELSGGKVDRRGALPPKRRQLSTSAVAAAAANSSASASTSKKPRLISSQTTPAMSSGWWAMKEERRAREVLRRSSSILVTTSMGKCLARTSGGGVPIWRRDGSRMSREEAANSGDSDGGSWSQSLPSKWISRQMPTHIHVIH